MSANTFRISGNKKIGFLVVDHDTFNNWGAVENPNSETGKWKNREDAADYAQRCHDFKTGRRMSV